MMMKQAGINLLGGEGEPSELWLPPFPEAGTPPLQELLRAEQDLIGLLEYSYGTAMQVVELYEIIRDPLEKDPQPVRLPEKFREHHPLWCQILATKSVDYYLVYIAKLLALIFTARPETLRSKAEVTVEYVLQHESMDELIRTLADDEVTKLAYKGMKQLALEVERRTGLQLFSEPQDLQKALEIIELRNLIVHNNGIINQTFVRRMPTYSFQIGELVDLATTAFEAVYFLGRAATEFDKRASSKFRLSTELFTLRNDRRRESRAEDHDR